MARTLIIYESKYGSTEEAARALAMILGPAKTCKVNQFQEEYKNFDFFVIGTPIYFERGNQNIFNFVLNNKSWLKEKRIALFCTCLSGSKEEKCLEPMVDILGESVVYRKVIGGRLSLEKLDEFDSSAIKSLHMKSGIPVADTDAFNLEDINKMGIEIRNIKESIGDRLDNIKLKEEIEMFLKEHNTCTLCTGFNNRVRATPIEYMYDEGYLYMISEGGEKFANILLNDNVSLCVYDNYNNFTNLAGMQITGKAQIIDFSSIEYKQMMRIKNMDEDKMISLPSNINMIKVEILRIEFLQSKFKGMGYNIRQIYLKQ